MPSRNKPSFEGAFVASSVLAVYLLWNSIPFTRKLKEHAGENLSRPKQHPCLISSKSNNTSPTTSKSSFADIALVGLTVDFVICAFLP